MCDSSGAKIQLLRWTAIHVCSHDATAKDSGLSISMTCTRWSMGSQQVHSWLDNSRPQQHKLNSQQTQSKKASEGLTGHYGQGTKPQDSQHKVCQAQPCRYVRPLRTLSESLAVLQVRYSEPAAASRSSLYGRPLLSEFLQPSCNVMLSS